MPENLVACPDCDLLQRIPSLPPGETAHRMRCGEEIAFRRPESIQRAGALLAAALICYLPANLLPVLTTATPTSVEDNTIVSGAIALYTTGSWHLALIVLIATRNDRCSTRSSATPRAGGSCSRP